MDIADFVLFQQSFDDEFAGLDDCANFNHWLNIDIGDFTLFEARFNRWGACP